MTLRSPLNQGAGIASQMPDSGTVEVSREGMIAVVTLNRPPVNAFSLAQAGRLAKVLLDLNGQPDLRAIVLTGSGEKAFCAGGDIEEFASLDRTGMLTAVRLGQRLLWDIE